MTWLADVGYVPPPIVVLSTGANLTRQDFETFRNAWFDSVAGRHATPPDSYRRYVRDLYGAPKRDLLPYLGWTFIACFIALVGFIGYALAR